MHAKTHAASLLVQVKFHAYLTVRKSDMAEISSLNLLKLPRSDLELIIGFGRNGFNCQSWLCSQELGDQRLMSPRHLVGWELMWWVNIHTICSLGCYRNIYVRVHVGLTLNPDFLTCFLGDGKLEIDDVMDSLDVINQHSINGAQLMEAFQLFDINKDGFIRWVQ